MAFTDSQEIEGIEGSESVSLFIQTELEQIQQEIKEISHMLEQSEIEVDKLAQRNATISMHLQKVKASMEEIPKSDILVAYDAALDAQQRLVLTRSQVEKLRSDRDHNERYRRVLERVVNALSEETQAGEGKSKGSIATAEMMIQSQETERQRLSRQMHDGPAQALSNLILQTEIAMRLFKVDQEKALEELENLKVAATSTFQHVRDFIVELRPMMLDDLGLAPTIKRYVDSFRERSGLDVSSSVTGTEARIESYTEVMVFRAVQELLANVAQYSQANQVKVQIDSTEDEVRVSVEDNGKGFDTDELMESKGLGIKLIRERVEMLGGTFNVDSALGKGTRVSFSVPAKPG